MSPVARSWGPGLPPCEACPGRAQPPPCLSWSSLTWGFSVPSIEEILADSEDEEDEEEERSRGKEQRRLARQRSRAWLKEGGGDEPLNFLDPKVAQRVLGEQEVAGPWAQRTGLPRAKFGSRMASREASGHPHLLHTHMVVLRVPIQGADLGLEGYDEGVSRLGLACHLLTA